MSKSTLTNHRAKFPKKKFKSAKVKHALGWIPDLPDFRDYQPTSKEIESLFENKKEARPPLEAELPSEVDLRPWCSKIEDQGQLGSCTAQAAVGIVEYYERRAFGNHLDGSRLFVYKAERNLMRLTGDTGAYLRTAIKALALFGVPPEEYWSYSDDKKKFDIEPPAFCYAFAGNYKALKYFRHDQNDMNPTDILNSIKKYLASGFPSMFGFTVYDSIQEANESGEIPFPSDNEQIQGGHAIVAVGYDDNKIIKNPNSPRHQTKGAFLIRNSWGENWGLHGYGYLPYEYVMKGIAEDWWTLLKADYIDMAVFGVDTQNQMSQDLRQIAA